MKEGRKKLKFLEFTT